MDKTDHITNESILRSKIEELEKIAYHKQGMSYQALFTASLGMADQYETQKSRIEKLEKALRFYSFEQDYNERTTRLGYEQDEQPVILNDKGKTAREALEE